MKVQEHLYWCLLFVFFLSVRTFISDYVLSKVCWFFVVGQIEIQDGCY